MFKGKSILAVIPARGGSKGLPKKNLIPLHGKELVGWPVRAALESNICDKVICSTDNIEIAKVAEQFGAEVPWLRPKQLASDEASTADVLLHAINFFSDRCEFFDYLLLLEPTSPLTNSQDIIEAMDLITTNYATCDSLVSVTENVSGHPDFTFQMDASSKIVSSINSDKWIHKRRQDIQKCYLLEGSIYISSTKAFLDKKTFIHERTIGMEMPKWKSFEIDDLLDLKIVEMVMKDRGIV